MKKSITSVCSVGAITAMLLIPYLGINRAQAQNVAINTSGNAAAVGAGLDVDFSTKGILIPRVSLAASNDIMGNASMQTSTIVYKSGGVWAAANGFYYWNGSIWVALSPAGGGWALLGNASTVDGTNFIGTTDNVPWNIRVNNQKAGRIDNTAGNAFFGYLTGNSIAGGTSNTAIGTQSLYNNTTGSSNIAIGYSSLFTNTGSHNNVAVGVQALYNNTGGSENTALGNEAMINNQSGSQNTAVGNKALYGNLGFNGSQNTALGYQAMYANQGGAYNTGIGYFACSGAQGQYNTAVGWSAVNFAGTGNNNTGIGANALTNPQSGASDNTGVGYYALYRTNGSRNSAFGVEAMGNGSAVQGNNNTALGYRAAYSAGMNVQYGANNTSVGAYSMYNKRDEGDNVALGFQAMYTSAYNNGGAALSTYNVAIGNDALYFNNPTSTTTGIRNTAVGYQALYGTTAVTNNGTNNTAVGYQSLKANTTAAENTALGYQALFTQSYTNTNTAWSSYNTAVGNEALYFNQPNANSNGMRNTGVGYRSLYNNTTGTNNIGLGNQSGSNITTGSTNIAIGYSSMSSGAGVTGNNNIGVGYQTLNSVTSGAGNTAVGHQALMGDYTGSNNVGVGYGTGANACFFGTGIGANNTFIGYQSGNRIVNNSANNTALGYQALMGACVGTSGGNNTAIGYQSLIGITTGSNNIALGYIAGDNITTGTKNIVIGYDIDAPVATGSNQLSIGNMIYGTSIDGSGTAISTGKIGIGVSAPEYELSVGDGMNIDQNNLNNGTMLNALRFGSGSLDGIASKRTAGGNQYGLDFYTGGATVMSIIGPPPTNPAGTTWGNVGIGTVLPSRKLTVSNVTGSESANTQLLYLKQPNDYGYSFNIDDLSTGFMFIKAVNNGVESDIMVLDRATNNVGIGTTATPGEKLEIYGVDPSMRIRNQNDQGGGFVGNTFNSVQFGMYEPTGAAWGALAANEKRTFFGYDVNGVVGSISTVYGNPTFRNKLDDGAGNMCYTGGIGACSDIRYKRNITPLETSLQNVLKLQGVNYFWRKNEFPGKFSTDNKQIGFIAQEIEKIYPELVITDSEGYKSVDYSKLTPILVEAIKEQQAMIDKLKAENSVKQSEIEELLVRMNKVEEMLGIYGKK